MVRKKRLDYDRRGRITPERVSNASFNRSHKNYALNFGSAFQMIKNSFEIGDNENKTVKSKKNKKSKYERKNKKLLMEINEYIADPSFSITQQSNLIEIKHKIQLQIRENRYEQKKLENWIENELSTILHPQKTLPL